MGQLPGPLDRGGGDGFLGCIGGTFPFEGTHFHHFTAQGLAQLGKVDLVSVFPDQVNHIDCNHHGDPQLDKLRGEVEVSLDVGAVYNV